ncbi:MAG: hypothetical protein CVU20_03325 [Betaproteobacteria bacterium HGW-Betaproteobacteria-14]|nr:MAG: hypothetical protein CVU20_03325 [Betaproteobacteria bacterium HGW-Betaproteobacteria-14]
MSRNPVLVAALAAALGACSTLPASNPHPLAVAPAPITYDGHVSGQATDYVFVLVPDANPATPGLAMKAGESIRLRMPEAFKRNDQAAVKPDTDANLVFTKGWPQGAVKLAGQYRIGYDGKAHAMTVTATADIAASGANAPGIKVIHLRGRTFLNPFPGDYPVAAEHLGADGKVIAAWSGSIKVLEDAPKARLAPTNFHLPPGTNADYQKAAPGQVMPHRLGLLLWGETGSALNRVGVAPRDLKRFPRYTGGLLVQDTNDDKVLDAATDKVVGGIIGAAPEGARGQSASSPRGADGKPVLSGEVLRDAAYPPAGGGGKPNPGLLPIEFRAGDKPGLYRPIFELIDGNSFRFTLEAKDG